MSGQMQQRGTVQVQPNQNSHRLKVEATDSHLHTHEQSHQTSWHIKPDNDAPLKRRRRGNNHHHKRHLLEAAIGVLGVEQQLKANKKGYDKHRKRHALETAIGAYGLGRELMATREN
jgi:hypothetical protein